MSNFVHNDWSEIENLVLKRNFSEPDIINLETFKQDLIKCITDSEAKENEFYKAFNIKRPSIKNGMFTKSDFFKYIQDDADNKWEQIFNYLSSTVFINDIVDGTANTVSFRMQAIAQEKIKQKITSEETTEKNKEGKTIYKTYKNDVSQRYTVKLISSTEKFSQRTSVFQAAKADADNLYKMFYGKETIEKPSTTDNTPESKYYYMDVVKGYINNNSINSIIETINSSLIQQANKINSKNKIQINIDDIKIDTNKKQFMKDFATALKREYKNYGSTKGFEMTYVSDNFDINISGGSYFQIVFKRNLVLDDNIAPIDKILLNRTKKQSSFAEEAEYISETLITKILVPEFKNYMDITNFCPTPNKKDVLGETIGSDNFKNSLKSTILEDFKNKNSDNNLTFDKYINSLFGKTIIQESGMTEKEFSDQIQARKSKVQGTLGELLLTALLRMKAEQINKANNNDKITVSILGQDKNLLGQQSHTDIIVNIDGIKIGIQAKQYNSNKFENKQTFYDEEVNVFGGKFIRYIAENSSEKNSLSEKSQIILNYLRYLAVANNTTVDVSKYLSQYYARFSRIEDVFEAIGEGESGTFNNFISYNFGMIPMSLILQDILDEIQSLEKIFILNPISVDKKDKNKEIACYILEDTNPFTIRYKIKTSKDNQNNDNNENNDEDDKDGGNNKGKLMRGILNFVGISVHVSKIRK